MSTKQWRLFVALTFGVAIGDLASKAWASHALSGRMINLPGPLDLRLGHNRGVAFNFLTDLPPVVIVVLTGFIALGLLAAAMRLSAPLLPSGLVLGGALGNTIDRLHEGTVVDMLYTSFWPTFNVADIAITSGAALWILGSMRPTHEAETTDDGTTSPS